MVVVRVIPSHPDGFNDNGAEYVYRVIWKIRVVGNMVVGSYKEGSEIKVL